MRLHPLFAVIAVCLPALSAHAQQTPQAILAMLPSPTQGDCDGAAGQKHDQAVAAFEQEVGRLESQAQAELQATSDEAQKAAASDPTALMLQDPRQTMALQQWLTAPGHVEESTFAESLLGSLREKSTTAERPIVARAQACERRDGCDPKPIYLERAPIRSSLASALQKAWPNFIEVVRKNLAWDAQPPSGLDTKALAVRMQMSARTGQVVGDLKAAAEVAKRYGCVQTAKLESPAH